MQALLEERREKQAALESSAGNSTISVNISAHGPTVTSASDDPSAAPAAAGTLAGVAHTGSSNGLVPHIAPGSGPSEHAHAANEVPEAAVTVRVQDSTRPAADSQGGPVAADTAADSDDGGGTDSVAAFYEDGEDDDCLAALD